MFNHASQLYRASVASVGVLLALAVVGVGCSQPSGSKAPTSLTAPSGQGVLRAHLHDDPLDGITAINVTILKVTVLSDHGPVEARQGPIAFNLLDLTGPKLLDLINQPLPAGTYQGINLLLTEDSTLVKDGKTYPLKIPSGASSGYKVRGEPFQIVNGKTTWIAIGFNPAESLNENKGQGWMLKPVAKITSVATASPADLQPFVDRYGALLPKFLELADAVLIGRVTSLATKVETPPGYDPGDQIFITYAATNVEQYIKAPPNPNPVVTLRVVGGEIGNQGMWPSGQPVLRLNERILGAFELYQGSLRSADGDASVVKLP